MFHFIQKLAKMLIMLHILTHARHLAVLVHKRSTYVTVTITLTCIILIKPLFIHDLLFLEKVYVPNEYDQKNI